MRPLIIAMMAGGMTVSTAALAQSRDQNQNPNEYRQNQNDNNRNRDMRASGQPRFVECSTLMDANVVSMSADDRNGEVNDFLVDTRNGRVDFAILETNGILGSNDRTIVIPYGALKWDAANKTFTLNATRAQLDQLPRYDPDHWKEYQDTAWYSTLRGVFGDQDEFRDNNRANGDEYTRYFDNTETHQIKGQIIRVDRQARTVGGDDSYAIIIQGQGDKQQKLVLLGPATYLNRQVDNMPQEGNTVTVTTITAYNDQGKAVEVAKSIEVDGKKVDLRNEKGLPQWDTSNLRGYDVPASKLNDAEVYAQGDKFGDVDGAAIDVNSGKVGFVIVSKGGVLGIGDTKYAVPFSALQCGKDNNFRTDVAAAKLEGAPKLPDSGVEGLNNSSYTSVLYDYYNVQSPDWNPNRSSQWKGHEYNGNPGR